MIFEKSADNSLHQKKTWLGKKLVQWFGQKVTDDKYYWNGLLYDAANIESAEDALGNLGRKWTGSGLTSADVEQNQFNAEQAELAYQRQRELRQTAFQDTVKDAAAAGINPYFAVSGTATGAQSAPQASASPQSGSPAGLDSVLNLLFAKQRFDLNRAQIGVAKAERQVKEESANNLAADTKVKEESARNLVESTRGIVLDNDWKEATLQERKEAVRLTNDLSRSNIAAVDKGIEKADHEIANLDEQSRAFGAKAMLDNLTAYRLVYLLPFEAAVAEATVEEKKAAAAYSLVAAMYQQKVIDSGIIEENARLVGLDADVRDIEKALANWDYNVKTGDENGLITKDKFSQFVLSTAATFGALRQATGINIGLGGNVSYGRSSSTSTSTSTVIKK